MRGSTDIGEDGGARAGVWNGLGSAATVPGHGPVLHDRAPLEAARDTDLGRFTDRPDAERVVGNLHRAYAELGLLERGGQIDVVAALDDMVTCAGRQPLTCLARADGGRRRRGGRGRRGAGSRRREP